MIRSLSLPAPRGGWHSSACSPIALILASVATLPFSSLSPPAFLLERPLRLHGAHPDKPGSSLLKILNIIASAETLLVCKTTFIGSRD